MEIIKPKSFGIWFSHCKQDISKLLNILPSDIKDINTVQ
jgi:hypothetical protein